MLLLFFPPLLVSLVYSPLFQHLTMDLGGTAKCSEYTAAICDEIARKLH